MAIHQRDLADLTADEVRAYCAAAPEYVREVDDEFHLPLVAACLLGRADLARVLLDAGADPNCISGDGETPLKAAVGAAEKLAEAFDPALLDLLLDAGADPNAGLIPALHLAAAGGRRAVAEQMLRRGADVNLADMEEATPLHWAAGWGGPPDIRMMRLLLRHGADAGLRDEVGKTVEDRIGPAAMREARRVEG